MRKLFVFGIGGTGARVIKSLTMLLAAGVKLGDFHVVPILIDPHKDLEELNRCKLLLKLYNDINREQYKNTKLKDGFFHTQVSTLSELMSESNLNQDFDIDQKNDISFKDFMNYPNLPNVSQATRDLINLLYSETTIENSLSVGFKGNPHVGAVVLNQLMDSPAIRNFETIFGKDDRIFIVGSIFGGTGAAGFPLLLKNFRESTDQNIKNALIGALTVLPYFKLMDPASFEKVSDIDSDTFMMKTRSALSYYSKHITNLNAQYYIADFDHQSRPYVNDEDKQQNMAHLVEMIGAYSIVHFANLNSLTEQKKVFKYCMENDADVVDFTNIGGPTASKIGKRITSLKLAELLYYEAKMRKALPYSKKYDLQSEVFNSQFSESLNNFFKNYFDIWLKELGQNERHCQLFNLDTGGEFYSLIKGLEISKPGLNLAGKPHSIHNLLLEFSLNENKNSKLFKQNRFAHFMATTRNASESVIDKFYKNTVICQEN